MERLANILGLELFSTGELTIRVADIVQMILVILVIRLIFWGVKKFFERKQKEGKLDAGKKYAIVQIINYLLWVLAIILAVDSLGFEITVLLAGSTALLVGLGLGLQDFFRDLIAGFIILTERTVSVGDVVEVNHTVGRVKTVGLRTTSIITREDIVLIIPNTQLTNNEVINWSQNRKVTRFNVDVGVAYGSDTELVKKILIECAQAHDDIVSVPEPTVFFRDFGNSSLDFSLMFFSNNLFRIERTKSELRFAIDKAFRENHVTIPFPQRDLWVRQIPDKKP